MTRSEEIVIVVVVCSDDVVVARTGERGAMSPNLSDHK